MRPLIWIEVLTFGVISALLASPALAQEAATSATAPPPVSASEPGLTAGVLPSPLEGPLPVAVDPPPAPPSSVVMTGTSWEERPSGQDYARLYPQRAMDAGVSGRVTLDCLVDGNGSLSCAVLSEEPPGYGFGDATIRLSRNFRMAPRTTDGRSTAGGRVRIPITWRISG